MEVVMSANGNGVKVRVIYNLLIIVNSLAATESFHKLIGSFWNDVAKILDFAVLVGQIVGSVGAAGDIAATDNGDFKLFIGITSAYNKNISVADL